MGKTKDGKEVEVRVLLRLQPKTHWTPEIYQNLGKDYGRAFLQREASLDIADVCSQHTFSDLTNPSKELYQLQVIEDLRSRLSDACAFHHIKMDDSDLEVQFLVPLY